MVGRKFKGFFLGVPILSEGIYSEDERLRRNGYGYALLSLFSYEASDFITSAILMCLCVSMIIYINTVNSCNFYFRLVLSIIFSVTYLIATLRSGVANLAVFFTLVTFAYYGLMYFTRFDR